MSRMVLDASVTMAWCFADECDDYADQVLGLLGLGGAVAPSIWALEVANVVQIAERRDRLTATGTTRFLALLSSLDIRIEHSSAARTWGAALDVGRKLGVSAYDASYLDLAMRSGLDLATCDEGLRAACRQVGVGLIGDP